MTSAESVLRFRSRSSSAARDGGRMKMLEHSGIALRTRRAPCQSISRMTLRPWAELFLNGPATGAVEVVEHLRVFQELALGDQFLKLRHCHEVVLAPGLLGRALGARRVRDGDVQLRAALEERLHERRLAGPGGSSDDEQAATAAIFPGYRHRSSGLLRLLRSERNEPVRLRLHERGRIEHRPRA